MPGPILDPLLMAAVLQHAKASSIIMHVYVVYNQL